MSLYVQSRGISQENGYCWLDGEKKKTSVKKPELLVNFSDGANLKLDDLIDTQKFSIVLVNSQKNYYLYITGLKARKERADFMGRQVLNSLLWMDEVTNKNEKKIRSIIVKALQGELEHEIDRIIKPGGEYEFQIDYEKLIQLTDSTIVHNDAIEDSKWKINHNSTDSRKYLADELSKTALPNREGLLVLVTTIKSASGLKETGVWRGLSNRVEFEEIEQYNPLGITNNQAQKKTILWSIAIAIVLIIAIALIIIKFTTPQQPQIEPSSPKLDKSTQLEEKSANLLKKELTSTELPSACQNQKEIDYFLSPCFSNVKKN